jgi:hypothetical protein
MLFFILALTHGLQLRDNRLMHPSRDRYPHVSDRSQNDQMRSR